MQGAAAAQVENSLTMNQAKTYFVTKHGKYTTTNVEFRVDADSIVVQFYASRPLLAKHKKVRDKGSGSSLLEMFLIAALYYLST